MHESYESGRADAEAFDNGRRIPPSLIGFGIVAIAAIIFIAQNTSRVRVRFLFLSVNTRVWLGLIIALLLGAILDRLLASWWRRRNRE